MSDKGALIDSILEIELEMFLPVRARGKSVCQDHPESFLLHRRAQFASWSPAALMSYLRDLQKAKRDGRNLMTYRYARMENLVPGEKRKPVIAEILEEIVNVQFAWQKEIVDEYPALMAGARPLSSSEDSESATSFETYLRGELESYSDETLTLLHEDIRRKRDDGRNMSREVYDFLAKATGFSSLDEAEGRARRQRGSS
jgi:hypothetical protein